MTPRRVARRSRKVKSVSDDLKDERGSHSAAGGAKGPDIPIAYIGGWGRSGSTLLSRMLGEVEGYINVGEVRDVFLRGLVENRVCGCGSRFHDCTFWDAVGEQAYGGWHKLDIEYLAALRVKTDKPWHVPALLKSGLRPSTDRAITEYGEVLYSLYAAILEVSGAQVVVDASKIASFAAVLRRTRNLSPRFIHLVRDPRGTLNSWMKEVRMTDDPDSARYMPRYSIVNGASRYVVYNTEMHAVASGAPKMLLRYEDLIADPTGSLGMVLETIGVNADVNLENIVGPRGARLGVSHTVIGNPMRHQQGWIPLHRDDAWRSSLTARRRWAITALTYPMLGIYKYEARA